MRTGKFSAKRLDHIRRLRKARRYFRQIPLFAFHDMQQEYPNYTYEEFLDDLRYRKPRKKRKAQNQLKKFGRYERMQKLLTLYRLTQEVAHAIEAKKLRDRLSKPYRVRVRMDNQYIEYNLSPLARIEDVEKLTGQLATVRTEQEADHLITEFRRWEQLV